jgi:acyl-CoA-binding protein
MDITELSMILESLESKNVTEDEFQFAVGQSKSLKNIDGEHKLLLYALYKQTTIGDNNIPKPESSDIIETSKWLK